MSKIAIVMHDGTHTRIHTKESCERLLHLAFMMKWGGAGILLIFSGIAIALLVNDVGLASSGLFKACIVALILTVLTIATGAWMDIKVYDYKCHWHEVIVSECVLVGGGEQYRPYVASSIPTHQISHLPYPVMIYQGKNRAGDVIRDTVEKYGILDEEYRKLMQ